jgi:hypothetical protein
MKTHWFWWGLTAAAFLWYATVTLYIAVRGFADIRHMLARLREAAQPPPGTESEPGGGTTSST